MFRVTFELTGKIFEVLADEVDTESHPYLIYIREFEFEDQSSLIISPNGNEARKRFGNVEQIAIPVSALKLLEQIPDKEERISTLQVVGSDKK